MAQLSDIKRSLGGDILEAFLAVGHNDDGTNKGATPGDTSAGVSVREAFHAEPPTGGIFLDFEGTAPGVQVLQNDPGTPDLFSTVETTGTATCVYAADPIGSGLPGMVKITNSGSGAVTLRKAGTAYPIKTKHSGYMYVYVSAIPTANTRIIQWLNNGGDGDSLQVNGPSTAYMRILANTGKLAVYNRSDIQQGSQSTGGVQAGHLYRFDWEYTYGSPATVDILAYERLADGTEVAVPGLSFSVTFAKDKATAILTSDNTNPADADTVTVNDRTYTFKTALTPTAGEVLIGATADATLGNLVAAVNGAAGSGTLYAAGTLKPTDVTASAVGVPSAHTVTFTATTAGSGGNSYTSTRSSAHLTFPNTKFTKGNDDNGVSSRGVEHGSLAGGTLSGKNLYLGPFGMGCASHPVGGYTGRSSAFESVDDTGRFRWTITSNGDMIARAAYPFQISSGGTAHYRYNTGDVVCRISNNALILGAVRGEVQQVNNAHLGEALVLDIISGRVFARGMVIETTNDPPDLNGVRAWLVGHPLNAQFWKVGNTASTTAGSDVVTFNTQTRTGTGLTATAGSADVTVSGFTTSDIGCQLRINGDANFTFAVTNVVGTTVTLDRMVSQDFASVSWAVTDLALTMNETGKGIEIGSSDITTVESSASFMFNIVRVLSPNSCQVYPIPTVTASNRIWKLKGFPYPETYAGTNSGGTVMQVRSGPYAWPFVRKGTGMATNSGSNVVTVTGWTSADIGRHLWISPAPATTVNGAHAANYTSLTVASTAGYPASGSLIVNDGGPRKAQVFYTSISGNTFQGITGNHPALNNLDAVYCSDTSMASKGSFLVTGVNGTSVTVDGNVPNTIADATWSLAAAERDGGATAMQSNMTTFRMDANSHIIQTDTNQYSGSADWTYTAIDPAAIFDKSVSGFRDYWRVSTRGTVGFMTGQRNGGAVTQLTDKTTAVTLNKSTGKITMNNAALGAGASVTFQVNNSLVEIDDAVFVSIRSGATADSYNVTVAAVAAGSFKIQLRNFTAGSLSEAVVLNYILLKGAST